ncbi:MAG: hypothetical protein PHY44_00790 [Lachnospiraceae bacterium]|nr:hypothetical protein [Lachnospiraceae bacterium]
MEENNIQSNPTEGNTEPTGDKTFTQDDVNRIVSKRLAEEKSKSEADLAKREQELKQREFKLNAKEILTANGMPEGLMDAFNCSDEETLKNSIKIVKSFAEEYAKSRVEVKKVGTGHIKSSGYMADPVRTAMGLGK